MEDCLIIGYDSCPPDATTLCVMRKDGDKIIVLNEIQGDAAFGIYHYLTGGAELVNQKDVPMKVISYSDDESDHVYCPRCHECIGSNDIVYEDFYCRGFAPMYCQECGQAMILR